MSFTEPILLRLSDQNNTIYIAHRNIFESEGDRIALIPAPELEDFEAGLGNYAVLNSAVRNTNQAHGGSYGIECPFQGGSTIEKLHRQFTVPSAGSFYIEKWMRMDNITDGGAAHVMTFMAGSIGSDLWRGPHLAYIGGIGFQWNDGGWNTISGSIISANAWYTIRATFDLGVPHYSFDIWDAGGTPVASQASMGFINANPFAGVAVWDWMGMHTKSGTGNIYWDDITNGGASAYPTHSPSPAYVTSSLPIGAEVDMSTAKCWMFKDGGDPLDADNEDVKFKYLSNNGSLGASFTLENLRLEDNPIITTITNSFGVVGAYASDGLYESKSSAWLECNVIFPTNGVAGGKHDKFGKYGHRRVGA